jgi:hypothetical protein
MSMQRLAPAIALTLAAACSPAEPRAPKGTSPEPSIAPPPPTASSVAIAPSITPEHAAAIAAGPADVTLTIATPGGRTRFAMGEAIPIELRFSSTTEGAYELDLASYDRSGRLWSETFHVDPPGFADPLADYFGEMRGGFGGLRPMPPELGREPRAITVELGEHVRFDRPGTYRLHVRSTRVGRRARRGGAAVEVASQNAIALEIVDDPAFAARELAKDEAVLVRGAPPEEVAVARRSLRLLATSDASRAMVADLARPARAGDDARFDLEAGLYGARDRANVIALLRGAIAAPAAVVSPSLLDLAVRLVAIGAGAKARDPKGLAAARGPLVREVVVALPKKVAPALAPSIATALFAAAEATLPEADLAALRASLAAHLAELDEADLARVLEDAWPLARDPLMAAPLRAIALEARPRGSRFRSVSDLALGRLFEVDPAAARAVVIDELGRGARPSFTGATLGLLPDHELPALDAALGRAASANESDGATLELHAETFARYATAAHVAEAWAAYRAVPYFRVALLGYLARHDTKPATAAIAGLDVDSLRRLSTTWWGTPLEAAVFAKLAGTDAGQAAEILVTKASPSAEAAITRRFEALSPAEEEGDVGHAVRRALAHAAAWTIPGDRLRALAKRCRSKACRDELADLATRWGADGRSPDLVLWTTRPQGGLTGWIGHYDVRSVRDLEARIATLPRGTTLVWGTKPADVDDAVMAATRRWAAARGITIRPR